MNKQNLSFVDWHSGPFENDAFCLLASNRKSFVKFPYFVLNSEYERAVDNIESRKVDFCNVGFRNVETQFSKLN